MNVAGRDLTIHVGALALIASLALLSKECEQMVKYPHPNFPHPPYGPMPHVDPNRKVAPNGRPILWGFSAETVPIPNAMLGKTQPRKKLLQWTSPDGDPHALRIQFFTDDLTVGAIPGAQWFLTVQVNWQSDAGKFSAEVDVSSGAQINLVADAVTVDIVEYSAPSTTASTFKITAALCMDGAVGGGSVNPTLSTVAWSLAAANYTVVGPGADNSTILAALPLTVTIPRWAKAVSVTREPRTSPLSVLIAATPNSAQSDHTVAANADLLHVPLFNVTNGRVEVSSTGAPVPNRVNVIFDLAL